MNIRRFVFIVTLCVGYFSYRIGSGLDMSAVTRLPEVPIRGGTRAYPEKLSSALAEKIAAEDAAWQDMVGDLNGQVSRYQGRVGIYLKDMKTGRVWTYHADDLFPSASLVKVPVMASVFNKIREGDLSLGSQLVLRRRERCGGSGSLKWCRDGTSFSVRELLEKMITESDNTATKMLVDRIGMYSLQQEFSRLGLVYTQIYPEGLSLSSGRVAYENYTTAREMAALMDRIYTGQLVDRFSSELMLDILKRNKSTSRLSKWLPPGWELGHKTGLLRRSCHDVGVIFSPKGEYILAVLTGQVPNYKIAKNFISKVARVTFRYYGSDNSVLVQGRRSRGSSKS